MQISSFLPQSIRAWFALGLFLAGAGIIYAAFTGVTVRHTIDPLEIVDNSEEADNRFSVGLQHIFSHLLRSDNFDFPQASQLILYEDGHPLGPAHSMHADIAAFGEGRYSHWRGTIVFSSSDNSDPRTNGRTYSYAGVVQFSVELFAIGVILVGVSMWLSRGKIERFFGLVPSTLYQPFINSLPLTASTSFILISLAWLFHLFVSTISDLSENDVLYIITYCSLVFSVESILIYKFEKIRCLLFMIFSVLNVYSVFFVFSGDVTTHPMYIQIILLISISMLYFVLFQLLARNRNARVVIVAGSLFSTCVLGFTAMSAVFSNPNFEKLDGPGTPRTRLVNFTRHPNIYFLGIDGLMPGRLVEKYLHLEAPAYLDVIQKHDGQVIPNMFADQVPTKRFWATMMNILPVSSRDSEIILGQIPSVVLATLISNGYETHASFWSGYFGLNKGPLLTSYAFSDSYSTCSFLDKLPNKYGFLGYCALRKSLSQRPDSCLQTSAQRFDIWEKFYLSRLHLAIKRGKSKPQFFYSHYPLPGHTPLNYRRKQKEFAKYRECFRHYSKIAARFLNKMLLEIRNADPTSIIFVFGDHGSYLSRGLSYVDDPQFVVQDYHGVAGAVFGADDCMPFLRPPRGEAFQTTSRFVAGLLRCLSGGQSPLELKHDFGSINQAPGKMRFGDYIYE